MTEHIALVVNGQPREGDVEPRRMLVQFLREDLELTGTHVGCDTSQCGACTVHVDGKAIKSCTMLAVQADGMPIPNSSVRETPRILRFRRERRKPISRCAPPLIGRALTDPQGDSKGARTCVDVSRKRGSHARLIQK